MREVICPSASIVHKNSVFLIVLHKALGFWGYTPETVLENEGETNQTRLSNPPLFLQLHFRFMHFVFRGSAAYSLETLVW